MKGVELRPSYWGRLAAALREQIPKASPEVARSMIDAAAELQRVCDEIVETGKQNEEELCGDYPRQQRKVVASAKPARSGARNRSSISMTKSRGILAPRKRWTEAERDLLRRRYPHEKTERIAVDLNRKLYTVYQQAKKLGLSKTAEYLASADACRLRRGDHAGIAHRFPKGHVPANKGLRRPGWFAGRMRETQFKKGRLPHNWRYRIGDTRVVEGYLYEKVCEGSPWTRAWKLSHHLVWKRAGRRIPKGYILTFKDRDRMNIAIDNLERISLKENARRNHWCNLPKELRQVIALRIAIKRKITLREKHEQEHRGSTGSSIRHIGSAQGQRKTDGHRPRESRRGSGWKNNRLRQGGSRLSAGGRRPRLRLHSARAITANKVARGGKTSTRRQQ